MAGNKYNGLVFVGVVSVAGCAPGTVDDPGATVVGDRVFVDASDRLVAGQFSTTDVQMLDLDGDGDNDLVWPSQNFGDKDEVTGVWELPGGVDISLNRGDATFDAAEIPAGFGNWTFVEPADIDGDGDPDLVFTKPSKEFAQVGVLRNEGGGRFSIADFPEVRGNDVGLLYSRATLSDIDMDGDPDVLLPIMLTADFSDQAPNLLFLNDGTGTFIPDTESRLPAMEPDSDYTLSIAAADFDGDGDPDLVYGEAERQSRLLENDGTGFFEDVTGTLESGGTRIPADMARAYQVVPNDIDGDGDYDLVVVNDAAPTRDGGIVTFGNYVLPNDGEGNFGLIPLPARAQDSRGLAIADVDGDGINDVIVGNGSGGVLDHEGEALAIWLGDGDEGYVPMQGLPRFEAGIFGVAVGDLDGDGVPDIAAAVGTGDDTGEVSGDFGNILLLAR